jgi:hypothetical protein
MKNLNLENVEEAKEYQRLVAGGYICKITKVEDTPDKEYLKIEYDIEQGEFKDYFKNLFAAKNFWGGRFIRSYKESALSFFKSFTTSVENSNNGYKFDNDETKLVGKLVGLVLGEEEYNANDGSVKNRLYVKETRSVDSIKKGDFAIPDIKYLVNKPQQAATGDGFVNADTDLEELPFN